MILTDRLQLILSTVEYLEALISHLQHDRRLIGWGGFKGRPNATGMVEIGYEIVSDYRRQGLATEAAQGLLNFAVSHAEVQAVEAHTLPEHNPST